ncbi:hypothetical protein A2866_05335 [Candidatus Roizmanbacteria bacterium RIFCSPHIGHO2_01_FULL_39_8]|uniref:HPt domain-containing protein n=3 Tax=Candidatus Roizmaniibacteriota TaxID=1752723 RepID=A0A1F7GTE5_9BACT|nr:MAG: hypothetical protein A2866_05335 [Candidatus Roizmanbacteria bacterium RIFCSPHIGHO2_01_FULL_39_8]OGK25552.1 MAG: hypothetical protein A3C28_01705 [Candidatus Roizmanbacteria bacterium RIFCSPHIGHO2_02_FULL_39_9]OGK34935.1 MAG: hypothetical protein A3F60_04815 [Candidatus Roizmanbacteria bacterium RIFCSPHIGHO2_12_FULL_39_8]
MSPVDLSSYKSLFIKTAKEFIVNLRRNLSFLSQNTNNKEVIYEIFRSVHSIKGQCLMMGFPKTAELCKTVEDAFHTINDEKQAFSADMMAIFSDSVNSIEQSLLSIEKNNREIDLDEENTKLQNYLKSRNFAFSLVELVIVVGIVAILLAITLILLQSPK